MTAAQAVSFKVVHAGARRVVTVSPAGRPELAATPGPPGEARRAWPGRALSSSCQVARPATASPLLALKVAFVGILAAVGSPCLPPSSSAWPSRIRRRTYVAGDPAWAHVTALTR